MGATVIGITRAAAPANVGHVDGVTEALSGLPAEELAVVELRFVRGFRIADIAAELGLSQWMVRRRLQVAVSRLRMESLAP